MVEYDDHSYCWDCNKHDINCYCFSFRGQAELYDEDDICRTPDNHPVSTVQDGLEKHERANRS